MDHIGNLEKAFDLECTVGRTLLPLKRRMSQLFFFFFFYYHILRESENLRIGEDLREPGPWNVLNVTCTRGQEGAADIRGQQM